jgi:lipoate---protein ligase
LKRKGGGGAVVLSPGILCITLAFVSNKSTSPQYFFKIINQFIIDQLEKTFGIQSLSRRGFSDIAIGDKKILGCSIYNSKNLFFYQGSLLVNPDLSLMNRYLRHPRKEPDYRAGRAHTAFVTSLQQSGYLLHVSELKAALEKAFAKEFGELI